MGAGHLEADVLIDPHKVIISLERREQIMYVKYYMSTNVITVNSDTLVYDAVKIMRERKIRRLPVVDDGKLVGIVTQDKIREITECQPTSLSMRELGGMVGIGKVRDIMEKNVMTVTPDTTVE